MIRVAYPDNEYDGRTKEGRAVKKFLATRQIVADGAHVYKPKEKIELTQEHKEYISNNAGMMSPVEIARIIFKDNKITNLNQEARAVSDYAATLDNKVVYNNLSSEGKLQFFLYVFLLFLRLCWHVVAVRDVPRAP